MSFHIVEQAPARLNRTELAVPGSNTTFMEKASKGNADVVFLDLEDAVADDRQNIGMMLLIVGQRRDDHLYFITQIFGEKRTQGTVSQTSRQDRLLRRATFTPEPVAGDTPCGVQSFLEIDREGEEIS